ncbi:hypothetical protein NN561_004878 [Cricetulus griseus]
MVQSSARALARPAASERASSPAQPPLTVEPQAQSRTAMEGVSNHRTLSYSRWSYDRHPGPRVPIASDIQSRSSGAGILTSAGQSVGRSVRGHRDPRAVPPRCGWALEPRKGRACLTLPRCAQPTPGGGPDLSRSGLADLHLGVGACSTWLAGSQPWAGCQGAGAALGSNSVGLRVHPACIIPFFAFMASSGAIPFESTDSPIFSTALAICPYLSILVKLPF